MNRFFRMALLIVLSFILLVPLAANAAEDKKEQEPEYAKWGKIALQAVKEKYPDWKETDFLFKEKSKTEEGNVQHTFNVKLSKGETTKELEVKVIHNPSTGQPVLVKIKELS
ncbi:DUF3889 domain-containing protein [Pseudalkalibacillus caeni]|uniref:DUF3889 domain-containing protein n=1 Tax=Exobacillus caeni TaxID=2574798 RepID=A0A5R9F6Q1_9BACL|nr:DUF3889 domain-containing protein [Pseudalkalibacillus caeni]TLS38179.1 DUF3889 domain-containing protein [Pseudalkalibacillus caeni]